MASPLTSTRSREPAETSGAASGLGTAGAATNSTGGVGRIISPPAKPRVAFWTGWGPAPYFTGIGVLVTAIGIVVAMHFSLLTDLTALHVARSNNATTQHNAYISAGSNVCQAAMKMSPAQSARWLTPAARRHCRQLLSEDVMRGLG